MYKRQLIVVAGDYNQWMVGDYLSDHPELLEHSVGNTRGTHCIDRIFSNLSVTVSGTVPPLETDRTEGTSPKKSDHMVAFIQSSVQKVAAYKMMDYTYRYYNPESEDAFGSWIASVDWSDLLATDGSNEKAEYYQREVNAAMERFFPLVTVRRKSTDPP